MENISTDCLMDDASLTAGVNERKINQVSSKTTYEAVFKDPCEKCFLLDVRTKEEWFATGVADVNNLVLVPILHGARFSFNQSFLNDVESKILDKDSNIFIICKSGSRSLSACKMLQERGYTSLTNVTDGYCGNDHGLGWVGQDLPLKNINE